MHLGSVAEAVGGGDQWKHTHAPSSESSMVTEEAWIAGGNPGGADAVYVRA